MQIDVFDPEVKGFADSQSSAIKHSRNQVGGAVVFLTGLRGFAV